MEITAVIFLLIGGIVTPLTGWVFGGILIPLAGWVVGGITRRCARALPGISRALLQVHLRKLEAAGLVSAAIEVSEDGKAMKFYEVTPFALQLTPKTIMVAARSLGTESDHEAEA